MKQHNRFKPIVLGLFALIFTAALIGCGGTKGKPDDMDQTDYNLALEAISVAENYLDGTTSASDAYEHFDDIYRQLDSYTPENSLGHLGVKTYVSSLRTDFDPVFGSPDETRVREHLQSLQDVIS